MATHSPTGPQTAPRIWVMNADHMKARIYARKGKGIVIIAQINRPDDGEEGLVQEIALWLDRERLKGSFDRLVLVAAPAMLDALRQAIDHHLYSHIVAEVSRDMTHMTHAAIRAELKKILWF